MPEHHLPYGIAWTRLPHVLLFWARRVRLFVGIVWRWVDGERTSPPPGLEGRVYCVRSPTAAHTVRLTRASPLAATGGPGLAGGLSRTERKLYD